MKRRSLIIATLIGTMLDSYDDADKTKLHKTLQVRIRKGMERYKKNNGKAEAMALVIIGDRVWKRAIDHFKVKEVYIEASNLVLRLWMEDEKTLAKDYGLGKGKLGEWAKPYNGEKAYELEKATGEVVDMIFDDLESIICKNCEFYDKELKACKNDDSIAFTSKAAIYDGDGCNEWMKKK